MGGGARERKEGLVKQEGAEGVLRNMDVRGAWGLKPSFYTAT